MVEALQMFLFLFKSKYRRKCSWFSPFLCSVIVVLLFCNGVLSKCSELNCLNGVCKNETCVCEEGWQGPECQHCGGKIKLTEPMGIITDGLGNYSVSTQCSWLISPPWLGPNAPSIRVRLESFATECGWDHLYVYDGDSVRAERLLAVFSGVMDSDGSTWTRQVVAYSGSVLMHFFSDDAYAMEGFNVTYAAYSCPSDEFYTNCSNHGECDEGICRCEPNWIGVACDKPLCPDDCNAQYGAGSCTSEGCVCTPSRSGENCGREVSVAGWKWAWHEAREGVDSLRPKNVPPATAGHVLLNYDDDLLRVGGECFGEAEFVYRAICGAVSLSGWKLAWHEAREGVDSLRPKNVPPATAGHVLLNYDDDLLRVGGECFGEVEFVYRYKSADHEWIAMESRGEVPAPRFAHAAIVFGHELIVYGGVVAADDPERGGGLAGVEGGGGAVSNEVWRGRLAGERLVWRNATPATCAPHARCGGLHLSGHSAVLVYIGPAKKPVMLSFFGHSPHYGYLHLVQEYYIEEGVWSVAQTKGWPARAGFGHTAAYDDASNRVYIHAGLVSESEATQAPSDALYEYNVDSRVWRPLPRAPTPRYLHAAIFVSPGMMLVFGGNAHNDTLATPAANKCYSGDAYLYDVRCARWLTISSPLTAPRAASAVALLPKARTSTAIFIAGFDGRLRSDALLFETGSKCSTHKDETSCLNSAKRAAIACVWRIKEQMCESLAQVSWQDTFNADKFKSCSADPVFDGRRCAAAGYCEACVAAGCAWCGACLASARLCLRRPTQMALSVEECGGSETSAVCGRYHSCAACHAHLHRHPHGNDDSRACYWDYDSVKCRPANTTVDLRGVSGVSSVGLSSVGGPGAGACSAACSTYKTCANCTAEECIWCASAARCVDKNAYGASFPLGGCRAWSTSGCAGGGVSAAGAGCSAHASCAACRAEPACGWCDDGAGGGRGACLPGGERRPHHPHVCPHRRWHFTRCPACQCNGHAVCDASARCVQPCGARAVGAHCEQCAPQHWGSPLNGGVCQPCECNAQAVACAADTGRCFCSTKGLAGDRCDKCDNTNHYHPDLYNKGCYYDLAVDYQFTFNLSKKEDRHLSAINFRNAPVKPDVDADFSITCSAHARMNLTVRTRTHPERTLFSDLNCTNFRYKFAKSEHAFGVEDNVTLTTFFVYVYDFRPPLWIQISFSQYPKLNLQQFFITFSSCFLLLLLVAAALWKIKQKYDLYRRRQRLFVEMEQMASRPFSQVSIELERSGSGVNGSVGGPPAPVALEPCAGGRAAVLSLVVRLPTGGTGRAPPLGGLALASALVTLGHHPPPRTQKRRAR